MSVINTLLCSGRYMYVCVASMLPLSEVLQSSPIEGATCSCMSVTGGLCVLRGKGYFVGTTIRCPPMYSVAVRSCPLVSMFCWRLGAGCGVGVGGWLWGLTWVALAAAAGAV